MSEIRVLLVEDHQMVAAAFRSMLEIEGGFTVVGIAGTIDEAVSMVSEMKPDVAVVDFRLPDGEAADHLDRLFAVYPPLRILIVTGWASQHTISRSMAAGAHGLLSKSEEVEAFVSGVTRVAAGDILFDPEPETTTHVPGYIPLDSERQLSAREIEVLHMLSNGASTSEVARSLALSVNTVRNHITAILAKLETHTRLEAVTEAMRRGIISAPDNVT